MTTQIALSTEILNARTLVDVALNMWIAAKNHTDDVMTREAIAAERFARDLYKAESDKLVALL
jgi:hypothetical protein